MSTAEWAASPSALSVLRERLRARFEGRTLRRVLWLAPVVALTAFAAVQRTRALGAPLWIDEGISLGISSHPFTAIPHVLRQDGSPPLYYLLLHVWTSIFGATGTSGHALSALFAILAVPAAGWAAWRPFGPLAGVLAAALTAFSPFLGLYADELRMYSLTFLLAALATGAFVRAYVIGSRRWAAGFGVLVAALMLTHGWGTFFALSAAIAFLLVLALSPAERRRGLALDGAIALTIVVVLFAAWIPTMLFQAQHTGAPWSHIPHLHSLPSAFVRMFGGLYATLALLALGGAGFGVALWRCGREHRLAFVAAIILGLGTIAGGYLTSRLGTPAWATRYLTLATGVLVIPIAAGLARLRVVGVLVAIVVCLPLWALKPTTHTLERKSNVILLAQRYRGQVPPGTLVVATQPDEVPVVRYYLGVGLRYVTPLGLQRDDRVVDWIDALRRATAARIETTLAPAVASVPPGGRILLVGPRFGKPDSPWTKLADRNEWTWRAWLRTQPDLRVLGSYRPTHLYSRATVTGLLLEKRSAPAPVRRS